MNAVLIRSLQRYLVLCTYCLSVDAKIKEEPGPELCELDNELDTQQLSLI